MNKYSKPSNKKKRVAKVVRMLATAFVVAAPFLQTVGVIQQMESNVPLIGQRLANAGKTAAATTAAPYVAPTIPAQASSYPDATVGTPVYANDAKSPDQINNNLAPISGYLPGGSYLSQLNGASAGIAANTAYNTSYGNGTINPTTINTSYANLIVFGKDAKPYVVFTITSTINGLYSLFAYMYDHPSATTDYAILLNTNWTPASPTTVGSDSNPNGVKGSISGITSSVAHSMTFVGISTDPQLSAGTTGTAKSIGYNGFQPLYLDVPTVFRNLNMSGTGSIYANGNPIAFQNILSWNTGSSGTVSIFGGSDGSAAITNGSSVWWYSGGAGYSGTNPNLKIYGGNGTSGTSSFSGDTHVTIRGLNQKQNINTLVGGNAGNATLNGNTNVDINIGTPTTVTGFGTASSTSTNNAIGTYTDWTVSQIDPNTTSNGVVAGGSINGTINGTTNLTIQSTGAKYMIGSTAWWSSSTQSTKYNPLANQGATSGFVTGGSVNGTINAPAGQNATNLTITGVGAGTWIPQIYGAGAGQDDSAQTDLSSANKSGNPSLNPNAMTITGAVNNYVTAPAVYGVFFGGVIYGSISGGITNTFGTNGTTASKAAWGMSVTQSAWTMTSGGAGAGAALTANHGSNNNNNFGSQIQSGIYGEFAGGSINGNVGVNASGVAISNYFDTSGWTDGFGFFAGGNDNIIHMGDNGSAPGSFQYGTSSGTINGAIYNHVTAATAVTQVMGSGTTLTTSSTSWAGVLEGFVGGNGVSAVPLNGAKLGIPNMSSDSNVTTPGSFKAVQPADSYTTATGSGSQYASNAAGAQNGSTVNGNIVSNITKGLFSIGNSAGNNVQNFAKYGVQLDQDSSGSRNTWLGVIRGGSYFGYDNGNTTLRVGTQGIVTSTWGYAKLGNSLSSLSYKDNTNSASANGSAGNFSGFEATASGGTATGAYEKTLATYFQNGNSTLVSGDAANPTTTGMVGSGVFGGAFNGYQNGSSQVYVNSGIIGQVFGGGRNPSVIWGDSATQVTNGQVDTVATGGDYDTWFHKGNVNTEVDGGVINGSVIGTLNASGGWGNYTIGILTSWNPSGLIGSSNVLIKGGDFLGLPSPGDLANNNYIGGNLNGIITGSATFSIDATSATTATPLNNTYATGLMAFPKNIAFSGAAGASQKITNALGTGQTTQAFLGTGNTSTSTLNILGNPSVSVLSGAQLAGDEATATKIDGTSNLAGAGLGSGLATGAIDTRIGQMNINVNAPKDSFGNIYAATYPISNTSSGLMYNTTFNIVNAGQIMNISGGQGYPAQLNTTATTVNGTSYPVNTLEVDSLMTNTGTKPGVNQVEDFQKGNIGTTNKATINLGSVTGNVYVSQAIENFTNLNLDANTILNLKYNPNLTGYAYSGLPDTSGMIMNGAGAMAAVGTAQSSYLSKVSPYQFGTTKLSDGSGIYTDAYWGNASTNPSTAYQSTAMQSNQFYLGNLDLTGHVQIATPYLLTDRIININNLVTHTDATTGNAPSLTWFAKNINTIDSNGNITAGNTDPSKGLNKAYNRGAYWGNSNQDMPLITFENTSSSTNGISSITPKNFSGYDTNSVYGYGLLGDTYTGSNSTTDNATTSNEIFVVPGQIRQFTSDNAAAGAWNFDPWMQANTFTADPTQLSGMTNPALIETDGNTTTLEYVSLFKASSGGGLTWPSGINQQNVFNYTATVGNYLTDVKALAPLEFDTGIQPLIYDYGTTNNTASPAPGTSGNPFVQRNGFIDSPNYPWTTAPYTGTNGSAAGLYNLNGSAQTLSGTSTVTHTNGAVTVLNPWMTDISNAFFPGNSPTGIYANSPSATQINSRYVIYTAYTSSSNTLKANDIILTESQAKALALNSSTTYNPAQTTQILNGSTPVNFANGTTTSYAAPNVVSEADGTTTITLMDGNNTYQINGIATTTSATTTITGTVNVTTISYSGSSATTSTSSFTGTVKVTMPGSSQSENSLIQQANVTGTGINGTSSLTAAPTDMTNINQGLNGLPYRTVTVHWSDAATSTTSKVTIISDSANLVDGYAVVMAKNTTISTTQAKGVTGDAAINGYLQAEVITADGSVLTPTITGGFFTKYLSGSGSSTVFASPVSLTSNTAVVNSVNGTATDGTAAGTGDMITVNYSFTTPLIKDSSGTVIGGGHTITSYATLTLANGVLNFQSVPSTIGFGQNLPIKNMTQNLAGHLNSDLIVSDTRTGGSNTGWQVGLELTNPLLDSNNNDLSSFLALNGTPLTASAPIKVASYVPGSSQDVLGTATGFATSGITAINGDSTGLSGYLFNVSQSWGSVNSGLVLNVPTAAQKNSSYDGQLLWSLYNVLTTLQ